MDSGEMQSPNELTVDHSEGFNRVFSLPLCFRAKRHGPTNLGGRC